MANNNPDQQASGSNSASAGQANTPEASNMATANSSAPRRSTSETRPASSQATTPTTAAAPPLRKRLSGGLVTTSSTSAGTSPRTSRNTSPIRKDSRPQPLTTPISTQPSAAAIQRALSAASVPTLQGAAPTEATRASRPNKSSGASGETTPQWPISPRLKSPPPSGANSRRASSTTAKKAETNPAPTISVQSATPQSSTPPPAAHRQPSEDASRAQQLQTPAKASSRGPSGKSTLATVQENSTDDVKEPSPAALKASADLKPLTRLADEEGQVRKESGGQNEKVQAESGSESAGKAESKKAQPPTSQASRPRSTHTKSFTPLSSVKSRQGDGKQGMTVETETVPSIPQSAIGTGDRSGGTRNDGSGTVRSKLSTETIRPKKERKKATQKARSLNQGTGTFVKRSPLLTSQEFPSTANNSSDSGSSRSSSTAREPSSECNSPQSMRDTSYAQQLQRKISFRRPSNYFRTLSDRYLRKASSKADIFEARVANAVEDANSSDSDETFVYESNPPEQRRRHHSRTPSIASQHSTADGQRSGIRNFGDMMDERRVAGKRSMKFSNNPYNDPDTPDGKDGSVRSHTPRHFGRFGRGGSHQSMFDQDSPFTQASKLRTGHFSGVRSSRPNSPRSPQQGSGQVTPRSGGLFGRNKEPTYDFDAEGADDERTPLVGTVRTPRRYARRITSSNGGASIDDYYGVRRESRCRRLGGAVLGVCIFAVVILSAIAFLVMSNRPMYDVRLERIENVLASEEELMLDLYVGAVNPNALGITVTDMDINVFAKSRHVKGSEYWWRDGKVLPDRESGESLPKARKRRRPRSAAAEEESDGKDGWQDLTSHWHAPSASSLHHGGGGNRDDGTDPPSDDDLYKDAQTMLLGRIFHLDTALSFDGSPIKRHLHFSTGELRLEKPGNRTETGGSERWEEVLQWPFELIVRGVLKYSLPISERGESAAVSASVVVHPTEGLVGGSMRVEPVDHSEEWEWVEWPASAEKVDEADRIREAEEE